MSYSLDDILPPRDARYIDGSSVSWMIIGHVIWIVAPALVVVTGAPAGLFAVAVAHLVALSLVVVAWATRARSLTAARAVAWVSTPLLGIALAILATVVVAVVVALVTEEPNEFEASWLPVFGTIVLVLVAALSVPTIGAFLAAVSHARSLRGGGV